MFLSLAQPSTSYKQDSVQYFGAQIWNYIYCMCRKDSKKNLVCQEIIKTCCFYYSDMDYSFPLTSLVLFIRLHPSSSSISWHLPRWHCKWINTETILNVFSSQIKVEINILLASLEQFVIRDVSEVIDCLMSFISSSPFAAGLLTYLWFNAQAVTKIPDVFALGNLKNHMLRLERNTSCSWNVHRLEKSMTCQS